MNDIRGYLIGTIWTFLSLLVPIRDFMIAMMVLFGLNLVFGIVAAVFNGEEWSWKKFGMFFVCCAVFFVTVAALFIIGHFLHSDTEGVYSCNLSVHDQHIEEPETDVSVRYALL